MTNLTAMGCILFACVYLPLLFLHLRSAWRTYRAFPGVKAFNFHLLDMLAASLGLIPTVWLVSTAIRTEEPSERLTLLLVSVAAGIGQLAGLFIGRVHGRVPPQNPPNEWIDALWVLGGALYGLLLLALCFATVSTCLVLIGMLLAMGTPGYVGLGLWGLFMVFLGYFIHLHV